MNIKPFEDVKEISKEEYLICPKYFDKVYEDSWKRRQGWKSFLKIYHQITKEQKLKEQVFS